MKDQLITVVEALRLAEAELKTHFSRRVKNAPRTIKRLDDAQRRRADTLQSKRVIRNSLIRCAFIPMFAWEANNK